MDETHQVELDDLDSKRYALMMWKRDLRTVTSKEDKDRIRQYILEYEQEIQEIETKLNLTTSE